MDILNRTNFAELLWGNYTKLIREGYNNKLEQYKKLFQIIESENINESQQKICMHKYDNSFTITHEYWMDNKERVMQGKTEGNGGAKELGECLREKIEMECAKIINNGFTKIGYDGTPLFSHSHPLANSKEVVSNLAPENESAMTSENMEIAITKMKTTQKDEAGILMQVMPDKLFVSPDLYFTALRIFHPTEVVGTDLNDINVLPNIQVFVMDYFDKGIWILKDSTYRNLVFYWKERARFGYERIPQTMDYSFYGYARFKNGYLNWRGLYGAKIN